MRHQKWLVSAIGAFVLAANAQANVEVALGSPTRVSQLFAYPNNCNVICYRDWSLAQTVEHYLTQSVQRDGYATAKVKVRTDHDKLYASISGVPDDYGKPLEQLLAAGDLAYQGASKLNTDGKWKYDWYNHDPAIIRVIDERKLFLPPRLEHDPKRPRQLVRRRSCHDWHECSECDEHRAGG